MKTNNKPLTHKERKELIAEMIRINEGIEAHQVPEPPADLEPGARKLFYKLRRAASIALLSGDELAKFCRSFYAYGYWRHELQAARMFGYYKTIQEAEKELLKHGKIIAKYDRVILDIVYEMCPELHPNNFTNGQHRTDD